MSIEVRDGTTIAATFRTRAAWLEAVRFYRALRNGRTFTRRDANLLTMGFAMGRRPSEVVADIGDAA